MSFDDNHKKQWVCGNCSTVYLHRVSSIVWDIGEPCLHQSPIKVVRAISRMLKPDKWQSTFDSDGKVFGFQKILKSIIVGGIDPSVRAEVWEFLLGCYTLSSTTEYRTQLRTARRERYRDLVKQCQAMHSSVGTGSLAYVVGSKIMDMRKISRDSGRRDMEMKSNASDDETDKLEKYCDWGNNVTVPSYDVRESSSDSADLVSVRQSMDCAAYDSSCFMPPSGPYNQSCSKPKNDLDMDSFDFPMLPVTNLFEKVGKDKGPDNRNYSRRELQFDDEHMHNFQIDSNIDLVMESNTSCFACSSHVIDSEIQQPISGVSEMPFAESKDDRVSDWLWTLHGIVVDVVRTDCNLEFYEDKKNFARMSDILAVYAWVDPATGYCQGMSDLLSPFVFLFEDDADAFWCFEMLIRRTRENFQREGPTGVIKQLQVLWQILELTDREMYSHLSRIGAESLHFAFRMLLVLFRRELSFNEALCMWEMMWAADFDESLMHHLKENCLEPLIIQIPMEPIAEIQEEGTLNYNSNLKGDSQSNHGDVNDNSSVKSGSHSNHVNDYSHAKSGSHSHSGSIEGPNSDHAVVKHHLTRPFCGLTQNFWSKNDRFHTCTIIASRNCDEELPVFCVAAILFLNRHKIIRETRSMDDLIKIFNDRLFKFTVKRCIRTAVKLRKKYFYKMNKNRNPVDWDDE
ncbi:small G protein signaling modulator 2-like isoform X1 [Impatiens glandulifera]|uniref:small G protein signaling modulator 2-like isoform X1 n=1 Tax=Impatiens glandulifera TaxID=253017 RepID=UPI001FB0EC19|nr:small G protein signaling modulator 2-like isoform X1 [Impatiens glandulifera]